MQDPKRHTPEGGSGLITMNSFVEIYLSEGAHPPVLIDVEQMRSFDPVANRKRNLLEDLPAKSQKVE